MELNGIAIAETFAEALRSAGASPAFLRAARSVR